MSDSRHVNDQLDAYVDGELPRETRREVEAHVEACSDCRSELESLQALSKQLQDELAPLASDLAPIVGRVLAAAPERRLPRPFSSGRLGFAAGLLVAMTLWLALEIIPRPGRDRPTALVRVTAVVGEPLHAKNASDSPSRKDDPRLVAIDDVIEPGSSLFTPEAARAEFMVNGSRIRLDENTRLTYREPHAVALREGRVWVDVCGDRPSFVELPDGSLVQGTGRFQVASGGKGADRILCLAGEVTIDSDLVLRRGQSTIRRKFEKLKGGPEVHDEYFVLGDLFWMADLWSPDELREVTRSLVETPPDSKAGSLARGLLLSLGPAAREPVLDALTLNRVTRTANKRRALGDLLPKLCGADSPPRVVNRLFGLLEDGDGPIRVSAAAALTRATAITPKRPLDFWADGSQEDRRGEAARWQKTWAARRP